MPKLSPPGLRRMDHSSGYALVLVLMMLVLVLSLTLAFFSRAASERQISVSSAANQQVQFLAQAALNLIVHDLSHEIAAGSEPPNAAGVFLPRTVNSDLSLLGSQQSISTAPSMVPARSVASTPNLPDLLVKQSLHSVPFFSERPGVVNRAELPGIPMRASDQSTLAADLQGRWIPQDRWLLPGLAAPGEELPPPDWIYLNRRGATPVAFQPAWASQDLNNTEKIIGRFAFNIYDVGGLIDVNIVGNQLDEEKNRRRGRLHQVALDQAGGDLRVSRFDEFVAWRTSSASLEDENALFDPKRDFQKVPAGFQALVNRLDLVRFTERNGSPVPPAALRFLTTFNRDRNAPSHMPDPNRPLWPDPTTAAAVNPPLASVVFDSETELERGTDPSWTVPAGTPVMPRRFPLSKLDLLANPSAPADDLLYYFGLARNADGSFRYVAADDDGRILYLREVANEGREPNFFEVLKAAITAGSLGRNAGNTYTIEQARDVARDPQIVQIGANIIDQWDTDDFPTTIEFPNANGSQWVAFHGIENLPYINNFDFVGHRPQFDLDRFQVWMLFDVWNPHQNAQNPPPSSEIGEFRIVPRSGYLSILLRYLVQTPGYTGPGYPLPSNGSTVSPREIAALISSNHSATALNAGRSLTFPNTSYENPTPIRGERPLNAADTPGLLVIDIANLPPAVPGDPNALSPAMKADLNFLLELYGQERLPPDGNGFYGAKPYNSFRLRQAAFPFTGQRLVIDLQYRRPGSSQWKTYQTISDILPHSNSAEGPNQLGLTAGSEQSRHGDNRAPAELTRVAYHGAGSAPEDYGYYGWHRHFYDEGSTFTGVMKFDPRTIRFGHSATHHSALGSSIRQSIAPPGWPVASGTGEARNLMLWQQTQQRDWRALSTQILAGISADFDPSPAEAFEWVHVIPGISNTIRAPFGFIANKPEGALNPVNNPSRYRDRDGIIRPGDGYLGAIPTANPMPPSGTGSRADRPLILNRKFRSVGEMGYAFRDLPWKTLDFFSKNSGDLGLLDAFSLDESENTSALVAGKVNLNSAPREVLAALLMGTAKTENGSSVISFDEASAIADQIVTERERGPFRDRGDLVSRVLSPADAATAGTLSEIRKTEREAAIRTLAEIGSTRTWNLLVDLVVQSGQMRPGASSASEFITRAERRVWVHLAIDRFTGDVLDSNWEVVHE